MKKNTTPEDTLFFFDLEVVPREASLEEIQALGKGSAPSNYRDPDKIEAYENKKAEELYRKWSFDPLNCHVIVCSFAIVTSAYGERTTVAPTVSTLRSDQDNIIAELDRIAEGLLNHPRRRIRVVAHNIKRYDSPVLMAWAIQSEASHLVQLLNFDKPWESRLFDTCEWWKDHCSTGFGARKTSAKLDDVARFLGVGSKTPGMDGSKVFDVYREQGCGPIAEYCEDDVRLLQRVYAKLHKVGAI